MATNLSILHRACLRLIAGLLAGPVFALAGGPTEMSSGDARLRIESVEEGRRLVVEVEGKTLAAQAEPLKLLIQSSANELQTVTGTYASAEWQGQTLLAAGELTSPHGSRFAVRDSFRPDALPGVFRVEREVQVMAASGDGHDRGFASEFALEFAGTPRLEEAEVFAPGVWYRHNEGAPSGAYGGNRQQTEFLVRENALALPFFSLLDPGTGQALALCHDGKEVASGNANEADSWPCDGSIHYGSIGLSRGAKLSVAFIYPCHEGETTYARRERAAGTWMRRSHPVVEGFSHHYTLLIRASMGAKEFAPAMTATWRDFYQVFAPAVHPIPVGAVYGNGIAYLQQWYRQFPNGAAGWPWEVWLDNQRPVTDWHLQMGFVGQQLPAAYLLLRHGLRTQQPALAEQARAVIDFWVKESLTESGLPETDYFADTQRPEAAHWMGRRQPLFLRTMAEGVEGVLEAERALAADGQPNESWLKYCQQFAAALLRAQAEDGSWPRSFQQSGEAVQLSKLNTTHPIRFLVKLYGVTRDEELRRAILRAGEFGLREIDVPGRYVGGTPDNPNTIDKEAGVLALQAFLALHELTHDERYLAAARRAADYAETWVYMWSFPIHANGRWPSPWPECGLVGQSLVATGHSYADAYMERASSDYARLARLTGDRHYTEVARLLQNNTLAPSDFDGRLGYASRAMIQEGMAPGSFSDRGSGSFLLWNLVAELAPLVEMEEAFGTMTAPEEMEVARP